MNDFSFIGSLAQWIEQQPSKLSVLGSNPRGVTKKIVRKGEKVNYRLFTQTI